MTDALTLPHVITEWPRNSRETMRLSLDEYQGNRIFSLRAFYPGSDGELRPGKNGLTLGIKHLPQTAKALAEAVERAKALGLIDDEGGAHG